LIFENLINPAYEQTVAQKKKIYNKEKAEKKKKVEEIERKIS